jgi:uncharacterized protein YkwD
MERIAVLAALVAACLVAAALAVAAPAQAGSACAPNVSWGTVDRSFETQVVALVNKHRSALGLSSLTLDPALTAAAEWKSLNMSGLNYFNHSDVPIGRAPSLRFAACGYPTANRSWGENIAVGFTTPRAVMEGWLASPEHRSNIEEPSYRRIGVGVASGPSPAGMYWTQDFGDGPSRTTQAASLHRTSP